MYTAVTVSLLASEMPPSYPFGWEPDADGFRGHVFATPDNSTVIISVKGTSIFWPIGGGGPTQRKDKLNDNLLFSAKGVDGNQGSHRKRPAVVSFLW